MRKILVNVMNEVLLESKVGSKRLIGTIMRSRSAKSKGLMVLKNGKGLYHILGRIKKLKTLAK